MAELKDLKNGHHHPFALRKNYDKKVQKIINNINKGLRVVQAFRSAGFTTNQYYQWKRYYEEEKEAGLESSPLIGLFDRVKEAEAELETDMAQLVRDDAKNGNIKSAYYMLDNRFGWKKNKKELEIGTKEDTELKIKIVPMVDNFEGEHGTESGDDSNSDTMD